MVAEFDINSENKNKKIIVIEAAVLIKAHIR